MKKFLSKIMFATVAVLSVAGFTSCNNVDDDPYVPTPQPVMQEQSKTLDVPAYGAVLSGNILDMYDVNVVLHSGGQTKEVTLTKANGKATETRTAGDNVIYYEYMFTEVDGQKGVSKAEMKVTPKADIKTVIAGMPAKENITMMYGANMFKVNLDAKGSVMESVMSRVTVNGSSCYPEDLLTNVGDGTLGYEVYATSLQKGMSR